MPRKVLKVEDIGVARDEAIRRDCNSMLGATMRALLRDHDVSIPSEHLLMISQLVGFLQSVNKVDTASYLQSMIAIASAGSDCAALANARSEYDRSHTALLNTMDLANAKPGQGGRA